MKICVTGGCGFIGSCYVRKHLELYPDDTIVNIDVLTYAGNPKNLSMIEKDQRYRFAKIDIADSSRIDELFKENQFDYVVNFAAESHVDRSIKNPSLFLRTNAMGTLALLDAAKNTGVRRYLQVSTDEVYGSLPPEGAFRETTPLAPRSPYSASKASADHLVMAYHETYGMDTVITRCSNNYGSFQFPEKMLPLMTINALQDKELPVYGDGLQRREWLFVEDHCNAIELALHQGKSGNVYNIGGENEKENIEVIRMILSILGKPESLIRHVTDRLGHDKRYSIDSSKIRRELGWYPQTTFEVGIERTVRWYVENQPWWKEIVSGDYLNYYKSMYENR